MTSASEPSVINTNGAWCWFQDERAVMDAATQTLVVGSVASPGGANGSSRTGNVEVTTVDLPTGRSTVCVLHRQFEADDHNAPALWLRSDGRWLAVYTKHKTDDFTRWRISEPGDPTRWGPEHCFDWTELTGGRGVTYSNLRELDGALYCFARAVNDDPCALVSTDDGDSWSYAGKLFSRPKVGYVNGYTRYVGSEEGSRIDLITTDHHPRDYNNSLYHGYIQSGQLHRSDGSVADEHALDGEAPSQTTLTTVVGADTEIEGRGHIDGATLTHGWTVDIRRSGNVTAAILSARGNDTPATPTEEDQRDRPVSDHRLLYARMESGGQWQVHQLALAGPGLLLHEQDYTGLAALDPYDLESVYLSTPIDPRNGADLACYEIFHGRTADGGASWSWAPITEGSSMDNLRPIVAVGDPALVRLLWFRGQMTSSQEYDCEVMLAELDR